MKTFPIVIALASTFGLCFTQTGCFTSRPGPQLEATRVAGSERVVHETYEIQILNGPTVQSPRLEIRVLRIPEVSFQVRLRHQAMRVPSVFPSLLAGAFGIGVGAGGVVLGVGMTDADSLTTNGKMLVTAGAIVGLVTLRRLFGVLGSDPTPTEDIVLGKVMQAREIREAEGFVGVPVTAGTGGASHTYTTDQSGLVRVDLLREFGLRFFEDPREIVLTVEASTLSLARTVALDTNHWTEPCVRMDGRGLVKMRPSAASPTLGEYGGGEVFPLEDQTGVDWYGIKYRQERGWVPRLAAIRCYHAPEGGTPLL